jgi:hypothetical protein
MSCGFGGHTPYEILRDLGGLIGSVIALIAAGVAYYAGRMQVTATAPVKLPLRWAKGSCNPRPTY